MQSQYHKIYPQSRSESGFTRYINWDSSPCSGSTHTVKICRENLTLVLKGGKGLYPKIVSEEIVMRMLVSNCIVGFLCASFDKRIHQVQFISSSDSLWSPLTRFTAGS